MINEILMLKGAISDLPEHDQKEIKELCEVLKKLCDSDCGKMALILTAAELTASL